MENNLKKAQDDRKYALETVEEAKQELLEKNNQLKSENQDLQRQLAISKNNNNAEMNILRNELSENKYKLDKATRILSRLRFRTNSGIAQ